MAKARAKAKRRRAENHGDFVGEDADKAALDTLAKAAAEENAKAGHNSGEVSDEVYEHHVNLIKAAKSEVDSALMIVARLRGVLGARKKAAQKERIDTAAVLRALKIEKEVAIGMSGTVVSEERNVGRVLRILGVKLGHQWSLFEDETKETDGKKAETSEIDARAQGEQAGRNAEPDQNNPFDPGTPQFIAWAAGHHDGTKAAANSFR